MDIPAETTLAVPAMPATVATMRVRDAEVADAEAIALVHVRTWQAAYRGHVPQEYLDGLDVQQRAENWRKWLAALERPTTTLVLQQDDDAVIGFATVRPSPDPDADPAVIGQVAALYVLPDRWGLGGGRLLMTEAVRRLALAGEREATLWVLESNERARGFYEAMGWRADGAGMTDESLGFPLVEVRYRRSLDTAA